MSWHALPDALMGSGVVVVIHVRPDDVVQLVGMQSEHVVETFPFQATDEAFANRIRLRCSNRCLELSWPIILIRSSEVTL